MDEPIGAGGASGDLGSASRVDSLVAAAVGQVRDYAIFVLDPTGTIVSWNSGAEQVKGYAPEEAIGRHFSMFYGEDDREDGLPARLLRRAEAAGHVEHTGWRIRKDGTRFWADVVITAVRAPDGALTGFVKVTRDLTPQKEAESEREAFLAILAHDIKTPATAIKGFASLLGRVDAREQAEMIVRIEANADRLSHLVDGLLEYARLQAGRVPITLEPVPLEEFVRSAVSTVGPLLADRELRIEPTDLVVRADRAALQRVLDNLLSNAAKYSPEGSTLTVCASPHEGRARVSITDHGRGIDADDLPRIFDEFERGKLALSDGGLGLGLASVRALVALQGGQVWIESERGQGTTVTFELPIADPSVTPTPA